jgi:hypothetical protein
MDRVHTNGADSMNSFEVNRRTAIGRLVIGGSAVALFAGSDRAVRAQESTPTTSQRVATAPPTQDGVGFVSLLVGGIIHDMPAGPVEIRLSRFTLEPGTPFPPATSPYPSLMYIETGASDCPGGAGRIVYGSDGTVLDKTTDDGVQHIPTGTTQYIPAGVPDGAGNQGTDLMSSFIIEFVPVGADAASVSDTPTS